MQTLSRLNRTHPEKKGTMVLDFENAAEDIKAAFEPYYETTLLSEATDPNLIYEVQTRLAAFPPKQTWMRSPRSTSTQAKAYIRTRFSQASHEEKGVSR